MEDTSNITQTIINTINTIFENLFASIDNNLYSLLDEITFINSDIIKDQTFEKIFGTSTSNGISLSIRTLGENLFNHSICFSELIIKINSNISINSNSIDIFSINGIIKSTLTLSLVNLVFSYSFRYIMIKIFVLLAPFSFLSLTLESTSWFFKSWLKNIFSLMFIQIIVSLVLLILFSFDFSNSNLFTKFVYVGGIYALIKANTIVREFIGGISTNISQTVQNFSNLRM